MPNATTLYRNRIALIFDFDSTLAPSTFHALLREIGCDPDTFEAEHVAPLVDAGWDKTLARYFGLIEMSRQHEDPVTQALMARIGKSFPLFDHVEEMFDKVIGWARDVVPDVEVEFYMLTAGMAEIPEATPIAKHFKQVWAGACHFNEDDELIFIKRLITHPDKIRYLTQLAKGFHLDDTLQPENVYREIARDDYYIPYDQMIYVGDGGSDMPAFSLMEDEGGLAIGVVVADSVEKWRGYDDTHSERRVQNLAIADYSEGSELMQSMKHAVQSIAQKVALRKLGQGE